LAMSDGAQQPGIGAESSLPDAGGRTCGTCLRFSYFIDEQDEGVCLNLNQYGLIIRQGKKYVKRGDRCAYRIPQWTPESISSRKV